MQRTITTVICCLFSGSALAQAGYIGAGGGQAKIDPDLVEIPGASVELDDDTDTSWKIFGGYELNKHLAFELSYADLGEYKATTQIGGIVAEDKVEADAIALSVLGILPFTDNFGLFGKVGYAHWSIDDDQTSNVGISASISESGNDPVFGGGLQYNMGNFLVRAEFERYANVGDEDTTGQSDVDVVTASAGFRF